VRAIDSHYPKTALKPYLNLSTARSTDEGIELLFTRASWHPSRLVRACIAVGMAIIGAVLIWAALPRPSSPDSGLAPAPNDHNMSSTSPSATRTPSADQTDLRDETTGLVLPESEPVAISIPKIGVRSRLIKLRLDKGGVMEVPNDPADPGWFTGAPTPGALGPAVIAGHVRWRGVTGVFHRLDTMRRGDHVSVIRKDGKTAIFTVTRVKQYSKSRFPTEAVYGEIAHAGLRLITCGNYDAAEKTYVDNVVVFAKLKEVRR
jgi:sortase (surface protein transpeptidase)